MRIPAGGGAPVPVEWTLGDDTRQFRVHPDGRRIAYVVSDVTSRSEVRALVNVLAAPVATK